MNFYKYETYLYRTSLIYNIIKEIKWAIKDIL